MAHKQLFYYNTSNYQAGDINSISFDAETLSDDMQDTNIQGNKLYLEFSSPNGYPMEKIIEIDSIAFDDGSWSSASYQTEFTPDSPYESDNSNNYIVTVDLDFSDWYMNSSCRIDLEDEVRDHDITIQMYYESINDGDDTTYIPDELKDDAKYILAYTNDTDSFRYKQIIEHSFYELLAKENSGFGNWHNNHSFLQLGTTYYVNGEKGILTPKSYYYDNDSDRYTNGYGYKVEFDEGSTLEGDLLTGTWSYNGVAISETQDCIVTIYQANCVEPFCSDLAVTTTNDDKIVVYGTLITGTYSIENITTGDCYCENANDDTADIYPRGSSGSSLVSALAAGLDITSAVEEIGGGECTVYIDLVVPDIGDGGWGCSTTFTANLGSADTSEPIVTLSLSDDLILTGTADANGSDLFEIDLHIYKDTEDIDENGVWYHYGNGDTVNDFNYFNSLLTTGIDLKNLPSGAEESSELEIVDGSSYKAAVKFYCTDESVDIVKDPVVSNTVIYHVETDETDEAPSINFSNTTLRELWGELVSATENICGSLPEDDLGNKKIGIKSIHDALISHLALTRSKTTNLTPGDYMKGIAVAARYYTNGNNISSATSSALENTLTEIIDMLKAPYTCSYPGCLKRGNFESTDYGGEQKYYCCDAHKSNLCGTHGIEYYDKCPSCTYCVVCGNVIDEGFERENADNTEWYCYTCANSTLTADPMSNCSRCGAHLTVYEEWVHGGGGICNTCNTETVKYEYANAQGHYKVTYDGAGNEIDREGPENHYDYDAPTCICGANPHAYWDSNANCDSWYMSAEEAAANCGCISDSPPEIPCFCCGTVFESSDGKQLCDNCSDSWTSCADCGKPILTTSNFCGCGNGISPAGTAYEAADGTYYCIECYHDEHCECVGSREYYVYCTHYNDGMIPLYVCPYKDHVSHGTGADGYQMGDTWECPSCGVAHEIYTS